VPAKRFGCNVISELTNSCEMSFMVFEGLFQAETFIRLCERLIKQSPRKVFLIADGHPAHRAKLVKHWLTEQTQRVEPFFLPGYAPDLNVDERLTATSSVLSPKWSRAIAKRRSVDVSLPAQELTTNRYLRTLVTLEYDGSR
jgi:hypothetical protein